MEKLWEGIKGFIRDEEGATVVEYAVLIALIIAACIAVIGVLSTQIQTAFNQVSNAIGN